MINSRVSFEDVRYGKLTGTVRGVMPDIINGQQKAIVELDHELPGLMQAVSIINLTQEAMTEASTTNQKVIRT